MSAISIMTIFTNLVAIECVSKLVDNGIEISIKRDERLGVYLDLHLEAKSHLYLFVKDGKCFADMRYNKCEEIEGFSDLTFAALSGMHGREYINARWKNILSEKYPETFSHLV